MNYRVIWKASAEHQLSNIYLRAADKPRLVTTADRIVAWLRRDPTTLGESRANQDRVIIESPLAITDRVDDKSKTVLILRVNAFDRRSP